jgi:hypothetical protein
MYSRWPSTHTLEILFIYQRHLYLRHLFRTTILKIAISFILIFFFMVYIRITIFIIVLRYALGRGVQFSGDKISGKALDWMRQRRAFSMELG